MHTRQGIPCAHPRRVQAHHTFFLLSIAILLTIQSGCLAKNVTAESQPATAATPPSAPTPGPAASATWLPTSTNTPLPAATATAPSGSTPGTTCTEKHGHVVAYKIDTQYLKKPLEFNVYLPPCFQADGAVRYPVLYLLHGQLFTQDQWVDLGVPDWADYLISHGEVKPFMVVMPLENNSAGNPFTSGYEEALIDSVIPLVDRTFPTCSLRQCRAVGGLSRGASWAVYLGLTHWQLFGEIGAHSLPTFYGTDTSTSRWLADIPLDERPRIWIDVGDRDPTKKNAGEYDALLTKLNVAHEFHLLPGEHDAEYWSSNVQTYLRWYAAGWENLPAYSPLAEGLMEIR